MKRTFVLLAILTAFTFPASSAGAASNQAQQIRVLQQQVKILQKQVRSLQQQVKVATKGVDFAIAAVTCNAAITVDTFQATWAVFNTFWGGTTPPPFLFLTPVSDYGSCAAIGPDPTTVQRTPAEQSPTLEAFKQLIFWLGG